MSPSSLQTLVDAMNDGNHLRLVDHEITGLLGWMAGSSGSREARELRKNFGPAGQDDRITARGFRLLDHALFDRQTLLESAAGVGEDRTNDARRRRYRLLLSAFHPDRYPDRVDWLTERSQIITIAYSRFKSGKRPTRPEPVIKPGPAALRKRPRRFVRPPTRWLSRLAMLLRQRFGGDPWLAQKIIGGFALVLLLPLLSVLLDTHTPRSVHSNPKESAPTTPVAAAPATSVPETTVIALEPTAPTLARRDDGHRDKDNQNNGNRDNGNRDEGNSNDQAITATAAHAAIEARRGTPESSALEPGPQDSAVDLSVAAAESPQTDRTEPVDQASMRSNDPRSGSDAAPRGTADSPPLSIPSLPEQLIARDTPTAEPSPALQGPTAGVASDRPSEVSTADNPTFTQADSIDEPTPTARGRLLLGPLSSHQIGALLQQYQLALEQADIETLSQLVGREQAETLRARFPGLFESDQQHRVDLSILQSQRDGDQWVVQLQQEVGVSAIDRRARSFSHRAEFRFSPDPFAIQMIEMEF